MPEENDLSGEPRRLDDIYVLNSNSLRSIFSVLFAYWINIIVVVVLCSAAALFFASKQVSTYRASATIMLETIRSNVLNGQNLFIIPEINDSEIQNEISVIESDVIIAPVVDALDLLNNPEFRTDTSADDQDGNDTPLMSQDQLRQDLIDKIRERMTIRTTGASRILTISVWAEGAELSAKLTNAIVEGYVAYRRELRLEIIRFGENWLRDRIFHQKERVDESELALESARNTVSGGSGGGLEVSRRQLEATQKALAEAQGLLAQQKEYRDLLARAATQVALSEVEIARLPSGALRSAIAKRAILVGQNQPEELAKVDTEVAAAISETQARVLGDLSSVERRIQEIRASAAELENQTSELSSQQIELRQLERDAEINRLFYETLLTRLQETASQEQLFVPDVRILEIATVPFTPQTANKPLALIAGFLLGLALSSAYAFTREHLNDAVRTPTSIRTLFQLEVLALMPRLSRRKTRQLFHDASNQKTDPLMEMAFSTGVGKLLDQQAVEGRLVQVVTVTSALPGEGKSTASMLFGFEAASRQKSVIVVDCDLQRPSVSRLYELKATGPGLSEVLKGEATLAEAVVEVKDRLSVLPARNHSRKSAMSGKLIDSDAMQTLVQELSQTYDLVILDGAPALLSGNIRILAHVSDAILFVIRWNQTPRAAIAEALREIGEERMNRVRTLLTMVDTARLSRISIDGFRDFRSKYAREY